MKKITFTNNFHNTKCTVNYKPGQTVLSRSQMRRIENKLCGISDCCCGTVRGSQDVEWDKTINMDSHGTYIAIEILSFLD